MCDLQTLCWSRATCATTSSSDDAGKRWSEIKFLTNSSIFHRLSTLESTVTCRKPVLQGLTATAISLLNWALTSLPSNCSLKAARYLEYDSAVQAPHVITPATSGSGSADPPPWHPPLPWIPWHPLPRPHISKQLLDKSKELQTYQAPNCITTVLLIHPSPFPFPQPPSIANPPFLRMKTITYQGH